MTIHDEKRFLAGQQFREEMAVKEEADRIDPSDKTLDHDRLVKLNNNGIIDNSLLGLIYPLGAIINMPMDYTKFNLETFSGGDFLKTDGRELSSTLYAELFSVYKDSFGANTIVPQNADESNAVSGVSTGYYGAKSNDVGENILMSAKVDGNTSVTFQKYNKTTNIFTSVSEPVDVTYSTPLPFITAMANEDILIVSSKYKKQRFFHKENGLWVLKSDNASGSSYIYRSDGVKFDWLTEEFYIFTNSTRYNSRIMYSNNGSAPVNKWGSDNSADQVNYVNPKVFITDGDKRYFMSRDFQKVIELDVVTKTVSIVYDSGVTRSKTANTFIADNDTKSFYIDSSNPLKITKESGTWTHTTDVAGLVSSVKGVINNGSFYPSYRSESNGSFQVITSRGSNGQPTATSYITLNRNNGASIGTNYNFINTITKKLVYLESGGYANEFDVENINANLSINFKIPNIAGSAPSTSNNGYPYIKAK